MNAWIGSRVRALEDIPDIGLYPVASSQAVHLIEEPGPHDALHDAGAVVVLNKTLMLRL
jgi:hypothetical protein